MQQQPFGPAFWGIFVVILVISLLIGLTIQIFFLLTLYRTQSEVAERNREMAPGTIWWTLLLNFVPIVGNIWVIYLVGKLSNSLRREFDDRGWPTAHEGFGRTVGLLWAWGALVYLAISSVQNILLFGGYPFPSTILSLLVLPLALGLLVCFILYWVQMYQYGKRLREGHRGYEDGTIEADFDDEYRRPLRDRDDRDRPRTDDD